MLASGLWKTARFRAGEGQRLDGKLSRSMAPRRRDHPGLSGVHVLGLADLERSRSCSSRSSTACCRAISSRMVSRSPTASSHSSLQSAPGGGRTLAPYAFREKVTLRFSTRREASRNSRKRKVHHLAQASRSPSRVGTHSYFATTSSGRVRHPEQGHGSTDDGAAPLRRGSVSRSRATTRRLDLTSHL
jgi:hypothetical protein